MSLKWILNIFPAYDMLVEYSNIEKGKNIKIHESWVNSRNEHICIFCGNIVENEERKDEAHAIPECVGNKVLINKCECYKCNHLFGENIDDNLGKYIMPYRFITDTFGKGKQKNIIKDFTEDNDISYKTYRFESSKNSSVFKSETFDVHKMLIEISDCGMLQSSNNGYSITIPRQRYNPLLVYVSFLKMAYSIMPREEYANIVKGIAAMRIALENENMSEELQEKLSDFSNKKYYNSQPNVGIELINIDNPLEKTVDVCLMKLKGYSEPRYLFGLQLKYYTIIIPIVSDSFEGGELKLTPVTNHNLIHIRKLDFSSVEEKLVASFDATKIEIPQELYRGLEKDLRNSNLLRKEK